MGSWCFSIKQPRYAKVGGCVYHSILGDYNKWEIMDFTRDSETDEECFEEIHKILVQSIGNNMTELVEINWYGVVDTNDSRADGFYVVKFVESPHMLQEEVEVNDEIIESGSLACAAHYMSPALKKSRWYLGPESGVLRTLVKMNNVLVPTLNVKIVTNRSHLSKSVKTLLNNEVEKKENLFCYMTMTLKLLWRNK